MSYCKKRGEEELPCCPVKKKRTMCNVKEKELPCCRPSEEDIPCCPKDVVKTEPETSQPIDTTPQSSEPTQKQDEPVSSGQFTPKGISPLVGNDCIEDSTNLSLIATYKKGEKIGQKANTSHDPDGVTWISKDQWDNAKWDGVPINVCGKSREQICSFVFPNGAPGKPGNTMRGLRELFYKINPFADNMHPTVEEIDAWNVKVIQHFRNLIGATMQVKPDKCLFLKSQWQSERQFTKAWDTKYPGPVDEDNPLFGPCLPGSAEHCGARFLPSCSDQAPFLNGGKCCELTGGAEGIFTVNKDIPWSIKLSRVIASTLCTEGLGGHTGPFYGRELVGLSFVCQGDSQILRAKWSGGLTGIDCKAGSDYLKQF